MLHETRCLAAPDFASALAQLTAALATAGYGGITTRGESPTAGITAERDGLRVGVVLAALPAGPCAEPGHYRATVTLHR